MLTNQQIQYIKQDLRSKGISMPGLENDILDHLLCSIEEKLSEGDPFEDAYRLAAFELHGDLQIVTIQKQTIGTLNEGKSLWKNLINYFIILGLLALFFNVFAGGVSPALILVCISLSIFFFYHGIFQVRKQHSLERNVDLYTIISVIIVIGVGVFLFLEFDGLGLAKMVLWTSLVIAAAIPLYLTAVKKLLLMDSTITTFFSYSFKLVALISLLWIPLAFALKLYRPDVAVLFFVDDLLVLAVVAFFISKVLDNLVWMRAFFKNYL